MSGKQAKRLRRMEKVQEDLHDRVKDTACELYEQNVRLSNTEHYLKTQEARLTAAEGALKEQGVRLKGLGNVQDSFWHCLLETKDGELTRAEGRRRTAIRRAIDAEQSASIWKTACIVAVTAAALVVLVAVLTANARGESVQPEPVQEPPAVVRTVQAVQAAPAAPEENENERIEAALLARAHRIENCIVTHYDPCVKCCGKADGITASGLQVTPYVSVAVDPDVIPMGADVLVDYGDGILHYYRADDVGGTVKGNHIDLCVNSHTEALTLGVRAATVYWTEG